MISILKDIVVVSIPLREDTVCDKSSNIVMSMDYTIPQKKYCNSFMPI